MPRKYSRRRRSSKKKITKRSKSKKIRGGVTTRNGVRRGNYRFLSTLKAQDLTRLNPDIIGEIREMHPLLTTKLNNITLRHAVKDYLSSYVKDKRFIILKYVCLQTHTPSTSRSTLLGTTTKSQIRNDRLDFFLVLVCLI